MPTLRHPVLVEESSRLPPLRRSAILSSEGKDGSHTVIAVEPENLVERISCIPGDQQRSVPAQTRHGPLKDAFVGGVFLMVSWDQPAGQWRMREVIDDFDLEKPAPLLDHLLASGVGADPRAQVSGEPPVAARCESSPAPRVIQHARSDGNRLKAIHEDRLLNIVRRSGCNQLPGRLGGCGAHPQEAGIAAMLQCSGTLLGMWPPEAPLPQDLNPATWDGGLVGTFSAQSQGPPIAWDRCRSQRSEPTVTGRCPLAQRAR